MSASETGAELGGLDVAAIRSEFPCLTQLVHGQPLTYLDSGASSQTPKSVVDAVASFYNEDRANIHRGVHLLSVRATQAYDRARSVVSRFLNAADDREIIMTSGTTEGINLVAQTFVRSRLKAGDEILITGLEHHSNIVPWQLLCEQTGAVLKVVPISDAGEVDPHEFEQLLSDKTAFAAFAHVSNALGTILDVKTMTSMAHAHGVCVLIDGAQAVPHIAVDVQDIDADFYAFSAHKVYGPTGTGVLYGKLAHLQAMPPYQGGGDMITSVSFEKTEFAEVPAKFEAGTPNIAGVIGMAAGIEWLEKIGIEAAAAHEHALLTEAQEKLAAIEGLTIIGQAKNKAAVVSFVMADVHPHDIGTILDQEGVAVRAGHHCAQPVMTRFQIPATTRASFGVFNSSADVDALVSAVKKVQEMFGSV